MNNGNISYSRFFIIILRQGGPDLLWQTDAVPGAGYFFYLMARFKKM